MKTCFLITAALSGLACPAFAASLLLNPVADATVNYRSGNVASTTNFGTAADLDLFYVNTPIWAFAYVRFDLSALAGATITDATLTFTKVSNIANPGFTNASRNDTLVTTRFAVYGLNDVAGNTAQNWGETTITGSAARGDLTTTEVVSDTAAVQFDTTTRTISFDGVGETVADPKASIAGTSGSSLVNFLQGRLDAGTFSGLATFIVDTPDTTTGRGFAFGSREDTVNAPVLSITYTPVPEPGSMLLAGLAALPVLLRRRRA